MMGVNDFNTADSTGIKRYQWALFSPYVMLPRHYTGCTGQAVSGLES
jgi:hypothetical protein